MMKNPDVNWLSVERGVPITNDSYFVRLDKETGFVFDDRGGFMHQNFCTIDTRREITWIKHNGSVVCPVEPGDIVIIEHAGGRMTIRQAAIVNWVTVERYRVLKQEL